MRINTFLQNIFLESRLIVQLKIIIPISLLLLFVVNGYSQTIGPWNVTELKQVPNWTTTNVDAVSGITGILYESIDYLGNTVEVFAYYSAPSGTPPAGGWPAVVYAHGGGGTAFDEVIDYWNPKGYAAISMDLEGDYPSGAATPNPGPSRIGVWDDYQLPIEEQWYYHAIAQVVLAHSLIASFPEVNANKIGVMGSSWGGTITSTVMGVDDRFAWALPVYGGGFLSQSSGHQGDAIGTQAEANFVNTYYDGSVYFDNVTMPVLWMNGINDFHFDMSINQLSSREVQGSSTLLYLDNFPHGHFTWRNRDETFVFANSVVNGGIPLPEVGIPSIASDIVSVTANSGVTISSAQLFYTLDSDSVDLNDKDWASISASISGNTISANIPADATIIFFAITDSRGYTATSEYLITDTSIPTPNLALNRTATQSTTLNGAEASRAVDGDTDGVFTRGSVTAAQGPNAWWQVELDESYSINEINVFNRTNCCEERLADFTVSVINSDGATVFQQTITTIPDPSVTIDAGGAVGNIVRIDSNLTLTLNLAEVEVFGNTLGIENNDKNDRLRIYPNPVSDIINIDFKSSETAKLEIIDYLGKTIRYSTVENGSKAIDVSNLTSGLYFIKVSDKYGTFSSKIIKK